MSFRRFVYLVTNDAVSRDYFLRRIDTSRFFLPRAKRFADPPQLVEGRLPPAAVRFSPPVAEFCNGSMAFMLLAGNGARRNDKVIASDQTGRALLYDAKLGSVRTLTALAAPKLAPISLAVGNNLYIMDVVLNGKRDHCFDGLIYRGGHSSNPNDWYCQSLPPPPYVQSYRPELEADPDHVISYGLFGDSKIWISKNTLGTHSFDVESGVWSKAGDWTLPFYGQLQYIPEHNLWFGLSCGYGENSIICASDLNVCPPVPRVVWEDVAPPDWIGTGSYLVHLGHSKFCHARFFETSNPEACWPEDGVRTFVVFTGLEVEPGKDGEQPSVVQHRSVRVSLVHGVMKWVL